jgi:hypothetical protein
MLIRILWLTVVATVLVACSEGPPASAESSTAILIRLE